MYKAINALNVAIASSTYFDNFLSKFLPYDKKIKTRTLVSYVSLTGVSYAFCGPYLRF